MGNAPSTPDKKSRRDKKKTPETAAIKAKKMVQGVQKSLKDGIKSFEDTSMFDNVCGAMYETEERIKDQRSSFSEDMSEEDSHTISGDEGYSSRRKGRASAEDSLFSQSDYEKSDYESGTDTGRSARTDSFETEEDSLVSSQANLQTSSKRRIAKDSVVSESKPISGLSKPLASSFAKRCYFTKAGIGKSTQHYEGLTLTGNIVLMLAAAMKLKGCPTICDEDLRRVEQTYPNQFSRLPDELLLSSGWRRISKYCHFSNKLIPDGSPFFHSKNKLHPSGGFYFLLAAAVGMIRPLDVEPLTRDTLVLLETDYPNQCDAAPPQLKEDADEWTLVEKFCFFSGGPINTEEDVYYMADFDGNPIYMLAFLSPSLTPEELYKLTVDSDEPGLKSIEAVEEVESVYELTERDFDDLKLYHLGPCRALPQYVLQPQAWVKVLPPYFLAAKNRAMDLAQQWEELNNVAMAPPVEDLNDAVQYNTPSEPSPQISHCSEPFSPHFPEMENTQYHTETHNQTPEDTYAYSKSSPVMHGNESNVPSLPSYVNESPTNNFKTALPSAPRNMSPSIPPKSPGFFGAAEIGNHYTEVETMQQPLPESFRQLLTQPFHSPSEAPPSSPGSFPSQNFSGPPSQIPEYSNYYETSPSQHQHMPSPPPTPLLEQHQSLDTKSFQREVEEEGAFVDPSVPIDEAIANRQMIRPATSCSERSPLSPPGYHKSDHDVKMDPPEMDPPDDEPPSLSRSETPNDDSYEENISDYHIPDPDLDIGNENTPNSDPEEVDETGSPYYQNDDEYFDSPEKLSQQSNNVGYYPREQEYYDSPEQPESHSIPRSSPQSDGLSPGNKHNNQHPTPTSDDSGEHYHQECRNSESDSASNPISPQTDFSSPQQPQEEGEEFSSPPEESQASVFSSPPEENQASVKNENQAYLAHQFSPEEEPISSMETFSPRSDAISRGSSTSEYSRQSSAMRSAQDLLRKHRQHKRLEAQESISKGNDKHFVKNNNRNERLDRLPTSPEDDSGTYRLPTSPEDDSGTSEWESGSEMTSVISGSSVWTETSNVVDRSSRRALILQMAKARMKQNKSAASIVENKASRTIAEEAPQPLRLDSNPDFDLTEELD
eukprot:CAMPEP_0194132554 /NCGR_PEP_ID=MMETSP0152-20130528/2995_1 /TAXON_ID=1049557 /ORGANISM="Thalassiothrix antarctica, Strain L6-D1" /LENGTH=1109 /DNA_ID=CAMNT_0038827647 /DNA_START=221 /DNA_END=3550 /DNA_ORIENTATION=-